ncbi:ParA family protein [Heliophilum fasciatum]|uniref:Chromosome partitioning protein n=1 Tax=Heliophilum fasciatum TaxID=35700 RepID=A0A4R2RC01_9FIRM|nr:ParA family protein [Heliophilum fasciatum]MCW2279441.1 chromosome partitioning protein [Heliophilum fasciatum]TCP59904.1 chromosome partitioning protein [Heliophilum fasciatum]
MSCSVVSFMNMKGGVGKTTICVNLACCLSKHFGKKVLLIDFDPQSNASQYIIPEKPYNKILREEKTIYRIYKDSDRYSTVLGEKEEEINIEPNDILYSVNMNFDLLTGDLRLVQIGQGESTVVTKLNSYLELYKLREEYEFIFIDCPPTQSVYTSSALLASDYYIMPVKPDYLSSIGVELFFSSIRRHNRTATKKVKALGIIFSLVKGYSYYKDKMEEFKSANPLHVFENTLRDSSGIARATEKHRFLYDDQEYRDDIINITEEFLERITSM